MLVLVENLFDNEYRKHSYDNRIRYRVNHYSSPIFNTHRYNNKERNYSSRRQRDSAYQTIKRTDSCFFGLLLKAELHDTFTINFLQNGNSVTKLDLRSKKPLSNI